LKRGDFRDLEAVFRRILTGTAEPGLLELFLSMLPGGNPNEPNQALIRTLLGRIKLPAIPVHLETDISEADHYFAASLTMLADRAVSSAIEEPPSDQLIRTLGQDLDFLADLCFLPDLTAIQVVNLLFLRCITPRKSVAAVMTVRDEGLYLLEWVAFYRAIGLTDIFVYVNENVDGSDDLLSLLAERGVIRLIRNHIRSGTNPQRKAYQHAFHLLHELRAYKWVAFFDADEFLMLDKRYEYNIDNFIGHIETTFSDNLPAGVLFPWDWRLTDRGFKKTEGLLFERYPHSIPHSGMKCLTRLSAALGMCEVHVPTLEEGVFFVDSGFAPVQSQAVWGSEPKSRLGGEISHFWGKSFQEFAIKKRRGDLLRLEQKQFVREFSEYFEWTANLTAQTFHPIPRVLIDRTRRAMEELKALPGIASAVKQVEAKFVELSDKIDKDMNLTAIYEEMYATIKPQMKPD